jgi:hypothetical protein
MISLSANIIKNDFHNEQLLKSELSRLIQQSNSFSSVLISDADGHVIEYAPETLKLDKVAIIQSLGFSKSLESKKPYISSPYYSLKGNLVVLVSFPSLIRIINTKALLQGLSIYMKSPY